MADPDITVHRIQPAWVRMKHLIKQLWLVIALISAASVVLLLSDRQQRVREVSHPSQDYPAIAVMQISSTALLDSHVAGVLSRLEERGYRAPDGKNIRLFNPQGDFSTANAIARDMANGPYELVITSSTIALQTFSKANLSSQKIHVFGAVTDPYGAGVGIEGPEPARHPPYMAGIGTFQPVQRAIQIAHEMNPGLKRLGVVWNPGEQCSEACLKEAREICAKLGIELVEAIAANTSEVSEAARSLMAKRVDAVWVGGDTVATASIGLIISLAGQSGIPVFSNDPTDAEKGALFGLGADYFTVGQVTADVAAAILEGKSPASFRIENVIPEEFHLNRDVLRTLNGRWRVSSSAQELLDAQGKRPGRETGPPSDRSPMKAAGDAVPARPPDPAHGSTSPRSVDNRPARVALVNLVENAALHQAIEGVETALSEAGLRDGRDFRLKKYCAQGDISQLSQILDRVRMDGPDLLVTVSTPVLIAAVQKKMDCPIVFTVASDPQELGLFKNGRPENVCGIYDNPRLDQVLEMARKHDPALLAVGTIYDSSQMNALISVERLRKAGQEQHVRILEATATTVSELPMAVQAVIERGAGAIILSGDNLVATGFGAIHKVAKGAGIPIYVTNMALIEQGADGGVGDDYFDWGRQSGQLAAQVIAGVPPSDLPVMPTQVHKRVEPAGKAVLQPASRFRFVLSCTARRNLQNNAGRGLWTA